jgi:hypothetical protein
LVAASAWTPISPSTPATAVMTRVSRQPRSSRLSARRSTHTDRSTQNHTIVSHASRSTTPIDSSGFQAPRLDIVPPVSSSTLPISIAGGLRRASAGARSRARPASSRSTITPAEATKIMSDTV